MSEGRLCQYASGFFGFGTWKAKYWLIGIEERGAKTRLEFSQRFKAWYELGQPKIIDLGRFTKMAHLRVDWYNQTWKKLHELCLKSRILNEPLCTCGWGNAKRVGKRRHIALIEAMPFPAVSSKEWPYKHWEPHFTFMRSRAQCKTKFLKRRIKAIIKLIYQEHPKVVVDYAGLWKEVERVESLRFSGGKHFHRVTINRTLWISPQRNGRTFQDRTIRETASCIGRCWGTA